MDILTGSNQVINPEYIVPLDSKESPLSLLAKTCSSIGVDQPVRASSAATAANCKTIAKDGAKSVSPMVSRPSSAGLRQNGARTISPKHSPSGQSSKVSFKPYESAVTSSKSSSRAKSRSPTSCSQTAPASVTSSVSPTAPSVSQSSAVAMSEAAMRELAFSAYKASHYLSPYGLGPAPALDSASAAAALYLRAGLMAASTPAGAAAACREPLCKGCSPGGVCNAGCLQCKTASSTPALGLLPASLYPPPGLIGGVQPYICNWSEAGCYCGKRFSTSDELMSHLRTHTSPSASDAAALHHLMALPRTSGYPPLSAAAVAAASRYQPYPKPLPPINSLPSLPMHPSSLSLYQYLASPYMYGGLRR